MARIDTSTIIRIVVGPATTEENAIDYVILTDDGGLDSGGWASPRGGHPDDPRDWVKRLRRHVNLPAPVRKAGLRWDDATVRPYGWSQGAGHAPQGVEITWVVP